MLDEQWELLRLLGRRAPSADECESIQRRKLRRLIEYAYEHVPFYRARFEENGLRPPDIQSRADLRKVPAVSRDELRAAGLERVSRLVDPDSLRVAHTSGSSGKPWKVYLTRTESRIRRALELRSMVYSGIRSGDRMVTLGPTTTARPALGRLGLYSNRFIPPGLSLDQQVHQLRLLDPDVLWVYPTALRALLHHAGPLSSFIRPRMIIYSAELMDDLLYMQLERDGPYEIRNFYGSVECGRIAWACSEQNGLHVNTDCSIVQLEDDLEVSGAGRSVVITNLNARVNPYIRYRLGDLVESMETRCRCGSPFPMIKPPKGRDWDAIRLPSGRLVSPWGINPRLRVIPDLTQFRLIQKKPDHLVLQLKFSTAPPEHVLRDLRLQMQGLFEEPVTIDLEMVDVFENEKLKFRAFISELPE